MKVYLVFSALVLPITSAFVLKSAVRSTSHVLRLTAEEERAAALSDYLAKAHEEKLKAITDLEARKAAEIKRLQDEIDSLKKSAASGGGTMSAITTTSAPVGGEDLMSLSKEQLVNKIHQYQAFMADYIVKAQEQKFLAVKAAETAAAKKFGAQPALGGSPSTAAPSKETDLYQARNAAVAAAAAAGKSRWGDMEVAKVSSVNVGASIAGGSSEAVNGAISPNVSQILVPVPPEVAAADHGLRADGGVGGLSLAERVAFGANAGSGGVTAAMSVPSQAGSDLYQQRNARILAAAAAGKSRWGEMEIRKVQNIPSLPVGSTASTPSGRVNLGASFVGSQ
jgi:hypothetical protein